MCVCDVTPRLLRKATNKINLCLQQHRCLFEHLMWILYGFGFFPLLPSNKLLFKWFLIFIKENSVFWNLLRTISKKMCTSWSVTKIQGILETVEVRLIWKNTVRQIWSWSGLIINFRYPVHSVKMHDINNYCLLFRDIIHLKFLVFHIRDHKL